MKKTVVLLVLLAGMWQGAAAGQNDSTWSIFTGGVYNVFPTPDGKYLYCNQNHEFRFVKIDAMTGQVIDSIEGKGLIAAISPDWKYLYTCYCSSSINDIKMNKFENIKKLDINTYLPIDSIDNFQDLKSMEENKSFLIADMQLTPDNRLILSTYYGKYIIVILDATNLEILDKILTSDYNRSIDLSGINKVAISPKNDYIITNYSFSGYDSLKHMHFSWEESWVWDQKTMKPIKKIFSDSDYTKGQDPLEDFKFSPDGQYFCRNSRLIFKVNDFSLLKKLFFWSPETFVFDHKSNYLIISAMPADTLHFLDLKDYSDICFIKTDKATGIGALSPDDSFIYYYSWDNGYFTKSRSCLNGVGVKDKESAIVPTIFFDTATNHLTVNGINLEDNVYEYKIIDIQGRIILRDNSNVLNHQLRTGALTLSQGVYFLAIDKLAIKFSIMR